MLHGGNLLACSKVPGATGSLRAQQDWHNPMYRLPDLCLVLAKKTM